MAKNNIIFIVVGVICLVFGLPMLILILILATLAIPATQATIRHANETSATNTLRFINTEEQNYNMTYPEHGFTCSLESLGGSPQSGPPTPDAAQMIPADLASGHKAGYTFAFTNCVKVTIKGQDQVTSYKLTAVPNSPGHTGNRGYCMNENGEIRFDPKGGTNCTELLPLVP